MLLVCLVFLRAVVFIVKAYREHVCYFAKMQLWPTDCSRMLVTWGMSLRRELRHLRPSENEKRRSGPSFFFTPLLNPPSR